MTSQAVRICVSVTSCCGDFHRHSQDEDFIMAVLDSKGKGLQQASPVGMSREII